MLGALVLLATRQRFRLTTLAYTLILIHCVILMVGGHYTYAEVPLGEWLRDAVDGTRNNYDKLGHFAQGFVPAIITRELVIRLGVFNFAGWRNFFIVCFCLGFSAFYELIEWWVALLSDEAADAFLGTQGYVWDTQSDMGWALFGAVLALSLSANGTIPSFAIAVFCRPPEHRCGVPLIICVRAREAASRRPPTAWFCCTDFCARRYRCVPCSAARSGRSF